MTADRLTIGIVTPHAAAGPEVELPAMTGDRLTTVVHRTATPPPESLAPGPAVGHDALRASADDAALDRAAAAFSDAQLDAVAHASTTSGYVLGHRAEAELVERLYRRFGVPAVASCSAAVAALRTYDVVHLQLVHPAWFDDELDELGAAYFRTQGFDPVVTKAVGLTDDPARVKPQRVVDWVEGHVEPQAEAVYLAGNGSRAAAGIQELERRTGRLVLQANQALMWGILTATGTQWDVAGHGRLLQPTTSTS